MLHLPLEAVDFDVLADAHLILHDEKDAADKVADDALRSVAYDQRDNTGGCEDHVRVHAQLMQRIDYDDNRQKKLNDADDQVAEGLRAGIHFGRQRLHDRLRDPHADGQEQDAQKNGRHRVDAGLPLPLVREQIIGHRMRREEHIRKVKDDQQCTQEPYQV